MKLKIDIYLEKDGLAALVTALYLYPRDISPPINKRYITARSPLLLLL